MRYALTGGIACGKSLFSQFLNELGVETLDADDVVHNLESPGGVAAGPIMKRFGTLDRAELAAVVFSDAAARRDLEAILHPLVREQMLAWCDAAPEGVLRFAVIPLLFESHWENDFDIIISISASEEAQICRMIEKRGMSREAAIARLRSQMPVAEKRGRSSHNINNDGDIESLRAQARKLVCSLVGRDKA